MTIDAATRQALRELCVRCATAIDSSDVEKYASCFLPDGQIRVYNPAESSEPTMVRTGRDALAKLFPAYTKHSKAYHFLGQATYQMSDSGAAAGVVYCIAHHLALSEDAAYPPGLTVNYIRYHDRYRRGDDGEWRIEDRQIRIEWVESRAANPPAQPGAD